MVKITQISVKSEGLLCLPSISIVIQLIEPLYYTWTLLSLSVVLTNYSDSFTLALWGFSTFTSEGTKRSIYKS